MSMPTRAFFSREPRVGRTCCRFANSTMVSLNGCDSSWRRFLPSSTSGILRQKRWRCACACVFP